MPRVSAVGAHWPGLPHGDLGPWWGDHLAWSDGEMFVAAEMGLDLSFPAAAARLANLARGGSLTRVSEGAYGDGLAGLVWVGPVGAVPGVSRLVQVHVRDVVTRGEGAVLALRWQAAGPGGRLFPALDADMSLTPAGERSARLSLAGVYRLPLAALGAGLDRAVFHKVADATVRSLLARVADVLGLPPEPAGTVQGTGRTGAAGRRPKCPSPAVLRRADQAAGDRTRRS